MAKNSNLDSGFLLLYDWVPAFEKLPAKEVKALLLALVARQRECKELPTFKNTLTQSYARMIEPCIKRRLDGALSAKKERASPSQEKNDGGEGASPQREAEESKIKQNKTNFKKGEEGENGGTLPHPLGEEMDYLKEHGVPEEYVNDRLARAEEWAARHHLSIADILLGWWGEDKVAEALKKTRLEKEAEQKRQKENENSSFDVDDFFAAALANTYGEEFDFKK